MVIHARITRAALKALMDLLGCAVRVKIGWSAGGNGGLWAQPGHDDLLDGASVRFRRIRRVERVSGVNGNSPRYLISPPAPSNSRRPSPVSWKQPSSCQPSM